MLEKSFFECFSDCARFHSIVTEKLPTDLETLMIGENKKNLSLFQRMKMAKDAALGMNWLHSSNPIFIHRDLKLSNLLVCFQKDLFEIFSIL
jgi:serine/threonine protein kinase